MNQVCAFQRICPRCGKSRQIRWVSLLHSESGPYRLAPMVRCLYSTVYRVLTDWHQWFDVFTPQCTESSQTGTNGSMSLLHSVPTPRRLAPVVRCLYSSVPSPHRLAPQCTGSSSQTGTNGSGPSVLIILRCLVGSVPDLKRCGGVVPRTSKSATYEGEREN